MAKKSNKQAAPIVFEEPFNRLAQEQMLWQQGMELIAGIDEVGRGCLFGPVVAAAVVLPKNLYIPGVKDSKQLTAKEREAFYEQITRQAVAWNVSAVSVEMIERINIRQASRLAMKQAVEGLKAADSPGSGHHPLALDWLLVDAETVDLPVPQTSLIKGDDLSQSIAAASIVAKVTRDRMAAQWDADFPGYGLIRNKGYASREHFCGLDALGPSPMHRTAFLRKWSQRQLDLFELAGMEPGGDAKAKGD